MLPTASTHRKDRDPTWGVGIGLAGPWPQVLRRGVELSWVLLGRIALVGANAALILLLGHRLNLETYGLLLIAISAQLFLSRILMLGADNSMIRLRTVPDLAERSREVVQAGLAVLSLSTAVLVLGSIALALLTSLLGTGWRGWIWASVVTGAVGTALVDYGYSYRLARLQNVAAALAQGGTAVGRLGAATLVAFLVPQYPLAVFFAYAGASLLSGLAQTASIALHGRVRPAGALVARLIRYSAWQGGGDVLVVLSLHQGTFLLMLLGQAAEAGLFGLGLALSLAFGAVNNAFFDTVFPRMVKLQSAKTLASFLRYSTGAALLLALACVPVILVTGQIVAPLLRPELLGGVLVFYYLAGAVLLRILQVPFVAACLYLMRPDLQLLLWAFQVVVIGGLGLVVAPSQGAAGVAVAQLGGTGITLAAAIALVAVAMRSPGRTA